MRLGIFDHFGWAIGVTASADYEVVDRRRLVLVEPEITPAPMHYESAHLDDAATTALVETVRASVARATTNALDELERALPEPIASIALRAWPPDFPTDITVLKRPPYESRADAVMYRQILARLAEARGWTVNRYDAKSVVNDAVAILGDRANDVFYGPRARLGAPWTQDHRVALAATVVGG